MELKDTVTAAQMKALEKAADAGGLSYLRMMENAGQAVAEAVLREKPDLRSAAVFCGTGNNGGDGFVAARLLREKGIAVLLVLCGGKPKAPDAVTNFYRAVMMNIPLVMATHLTEEDTDFILGCDCVIDGLFGTGFHGELDLEAEVCCGVFNKSRGLKAAIDLPSGTVCDTGETAFGGAAADLTVTFHKAKPCHVLAAKQCGKVVVADIGIPY